MISSLMNAIAGQYFHLREIFINVNKLIAVLLTAIYIFFMQHVVVACLLFNPLFYTDIVVVCLLLYPFFYIDVVVLFLFIRW